MDVHISSLTHRHINHNVTIISYLLLSPRTQCTKQAYYLVLTESYHHILSLNTSRKVHTFSDEADCFLSLSVFFPYSSFENYSTCDHVLSRWCHIFSYMYLCNIKVTVTLIWFADSYNVYLFWRDMASFSLFIIIF